ncbi:hypothetical protein QUA74_10495 [Microcoleus sp. LAD1_D3]|uniref:hypothetical protein n=1 Tax=Microcoleus sp. LAD1_D3 TaxID=2819365 RepID=UPI002FD0699B
MTEKMAIAPCSIHSARQGPPQAVMFLSRAVKRTKLKAEAMELLGKLARTIKVINSVVYQKQVIADSSGQAATQSFIKNKSSPILRVKPLRCGIWTINQPHILVKSRADCLRKLWER